jgi:hypothetical protein
MQPAIEDHQVKALAGRGSQHMAAAADQSDSQGGNGMTRQQGMHGDSFRWVPLRESAAARV